MLGYCICSLVELLGLVVHLLGYDGIGLITKLVLGPSGNSIFSRHIFSQISF